VSRYPGHFARAVSNVCPRSDRNRHSGQPSRCAGWRTKWRLPNGRSEQLRQATFLGMREDKDPKEVVRDV
jgi:hypothetical protein